MWPFALAALVAIGAYEFYEKKIAKKTPEPPPGPGTVPGGGKGVTPPSGGSSGTITPPGQPQAPGTVIIPQPPATVTDDLHNKAAACVVAIRSMPPTKAAVPQVKAFQNAYNLSAPATPLQEDGKYGPKSQAALQSVIAPAVAPTNWFPGSGGTVVPGPIVPAPAPIPNVEVQTAAGMLVAMGTVPKAANANVSTFQHAYNQHGVAAHLVEDGKYGPLSQGALQSVLNYMGNGQAAPQNPYGKAPTNIPSFPG